MSLFIKAVIGAGIVILISLIAKTRNYYIAGLVPLFPTFALIAHYIVGNERGIEALRTTLIFSMWSIVPYLVYLITLYGFTFMMRLPQALFAAVVCWSISAALLIKVWTWYQAG
ncbi:GlpM family protein [Affinibrenneria salicis]|uniref:GlpM family protein n=1 Tax=Affinibrenneria salicis TaxID=2590031 RepID=A0A5J5G4C4_9GAMM|nr:GlpM family protein [Affinibrenneria salicis]KAA9001782.1 GlpM family protein [Affinibrenneria salicis]